jgi:hypothetical protein
LITPAEPILKLMNAGFFATGTLPPDAPAQLAGGYSNNGLLAGPLAGLIQMWGGYGSGGVPVIAVLTGGSGYSPNAPPNVTISKPTVVGGTQAQASALVSAGGVVTAVIVKTIGSGYTNVPTVSIDPPPAGAGASAANVAIPTIQYTGFVVSLGGNTMDLVRGKMTADEDVIVRFEQKDANGYYRFRVIERFALRLKDITAVVQLQFLSA